MRKLLRLFACLVGFALGFGVTAAFAVNHHAWTGKYTNATDVDGSIVQISGHYWNPRNQQCVLYGTNMIDWTTPIRMVQSGILVCNNYNIDGTCTSSHSYSERYDGTYDCVRGNSISANVGYTANVSRTTGTTVNGYITGASISTSGFDTSDEIRARTWAEASGEGTACPASPSSATFTDWYKLRLGEGWALVTGVNYHENDGMVGTPCWVITTTGTGSFNVNHS